MPLVGPMGGLWGVQGQGQHQVLRKGRWDVRGINDNQMDTRSG